MPRATAEAAAGRVRTRQKAAAAAATGQPSSSIESQHTTCASTSNAPGSPDSKHRSRQASNVSKPCNKQQQSKQPHPGNAQPAANAKKQQQDFTQGLEQPSAAQTQQQVAKEHASGGRPKLRQGAGTIQQQQRPAPQSDAGNQLPTSRTTRNGSRSATVARCASAPPQISRAAARPVPQLESLQEISPCRTSRHPTAALVEAAEAADLVACLCSGMASQDRRAAASWRKTKKQQDMQQDRHQQQHQAQQDVPTAAAAAPRRRSRRLAGLNNATLPTPAVAVVQDDAADQSSNHLASHPSPPPSDAATAEATPNAVQEATTVAAAAQEEDVDAADIPPTSLRARFARLSAEQQLSILLELEQLTQLEEACKAQQAARSAAAEAREKEKEAARQHRRRSGRLHQMDGVDNTYPEGGASRSGTPEAADTSHPKLGAAAAEAAGGKRMRRFDGLWLPIMTTDGSNHAELSSKRARAGEQSRRKRASPSPGPDALKHIRLEVDDESRQQQVPERIESPLPAAVSAMSAGAGVLDDSEACQRASSLTGHAGDLSEQASDNRPILVQCLGARAQARKGCAARMCA